MCSHYCEIVKSSTLVIFLFIFYHAHNKCQFNSVITMCNNVLHQPLLFSVQDFCIAWRKGLRRVWGLPYTTHGDLLPVLANTIPILDELHRRTANFINN